MKIITIAFMILISLLSVISCAERQANKNLAIKLNKEAMDIYINIIKDFDTTNVKSRLLKPLRLLDKAISLDSSIFIIYKNKLNVLIAMNDFTYAISLIDTVLTKYPDELSLVYMQGVIYKELGQKIKADSVHKKLLKSFDEKLISNPDDIDILILRILLLTEFYDKKQVMVEYDKLLNRFPDEELVIWTKQNIDDIYKSK